MTKIGNSVVIYGGGVICWTAAHLLMKSLPKSFSITVIENGVDEVEEPQCCILGPAAIGFFKDLDISEDVLVNLQGGSYRLASRYRNLDGTGADYFLPFCDHGFALYGRSFSQYAIWERSKGSKQSYDTYALSSVAARLGRFNHPSSSEKSLFSTIVYGYHINSLSLLTYLKNECLAAGLNHVEGSLSSASMTEDGAIESIHVLADSEITHIKGDFFIDCSGSKASLISGLLQVPYEDHSLSLPIEKKLRFVTSGPTTTAPYTTVELTHLGWLMECKSQSLRQVDLLYSNKCCSDSDAVSYFSDLLNIGTADVSILAAPSGRRQYFWYRNCLALGLAAGNTQDFGMDLLSVAQSSLQRFLPLFPRGKQYESLAREYNRLTHIEYDHLLDFGSLHCWLARQVHAEFSIDGVAISDRLMHRLKVFEHTGRMPFYEGDPFLQEIWISLLLGAGKWPVEYDVFIDSVDPQWINLQLKKMATMIESAASNMPRLEQYLSTPH